MNLNLVVQLIHQVFFGIPSIKKPDTFAANESSEYSSSIGLKSSLHGDIYQLKLLILFLQRGLDQGYSFRLATEMDAAEKFDDLAQGVQSVLYYLKSSYLSGFISICHQLYQL